MTIPSTKGERNALGTYLFVFGHMIISKIIKFVATRYQILSLKCTKFNFSWGSAPDPTGGAYSAPQAPLAGLRGPTSKGGEGKG